MSLTRAEWVNMWNCIITIEKQANRLMALNPLRARKILSEVNLIKVAIQQVIGQME